MSRNSASAHHLVKDYRHGWRRRSSPSGNVHGRRRRVTARPKTHGHHESLGDGADLPPGADDDEAQGPEDCHEVRPRENLDQNAVNFLQ